MTKPTLTPVRDSADEAARWVTSSVGARVSVREARNRLERCDQDVLVVTDEWGPVGIVTKRDLWGPAGSPVPGGLEVQDVMVWELVHLGPATDLDHTLRRYTDAAWSSARRRRPGARVTHPTQTEWVS